MNKRAFTLLEVVLALAVLGFCLATVIGLMPLGIDDHRWASSTEAASRLLEALYGDIALGVGRGVGRSDLYAVELPDSEELRETDLLLDQDGRPCGAQAAQARWRVAARLRSVAGARIVVGSLSVGWPPQAGESAQKVECFVALVKEGP